MDFSTGSSSTDAWSERRTSNTGTERGRLDSGGFGWRHHAFSPDRGKGNFYELLRQIAEEHEKVLSEKVSQKTAENTRLRFRLVSREAKHLGSAVEAKRRMPYKKESDSSNDLASHTSDYSPFHNNNQLSPTADFSSPPRLLDKDVIGVSRAPPQSPANSMCLPGVLCPQGSASALAPLSASDRSETESQNLELSPIVPTPHSSTLASTFASTPRLEKGDSEVMTSSPDETFDLRDEWQDTRACSRRMVSSRTLLSSTTAPQHKPPDSRYQIYNGVLKRFISSPSSPFRVAWDTLGALFIFYDMVVIPLRVFDFPESLSINIIDWFALVFWTLNMFSSFLVGYHSKGITILAPQKIALHYLRTWFPLDLIVLAQDWAFSLARLHGGSNDGQSVRLVRILRLIRTVRLLRLLKLRWLLAGVNDWVDSEYTSILLSIMKMIVLLLSINHFIACAWFLVAKLSDSSATGTWITYHAFEDTHWFYQYLTAFHWSITQFTPASMHVQPQNMAERLFAVAVVVFALVGFSYVVGSITSSLAQIRGMQEEAQKQFWNVRRYLKKNSVPPDLAVRITKYLEHAWQRHKRHIPANGIKLFTLLSEQLHNELQLSMSVPHLIVHPLFAYLQQSCVGICSRLANTAISRKLLAQHDTLFYPGESATHMYFIVQGRLRYTRVDPMGEEHIEMVDKGEDWISEPVLWTAAWVHLGVLCAETEVDLLLINAAKFNSIISLNPGVYRLVSCYASKFIEWINNKSTIELSDVVQGDLAKDTFRSFIPVTEDELLTQMSFKPK